MKTKVKAILLSVVMFIAGIISAYAFFRCEFMPDFSMDIVKFAMEAGTNAYMCGYIDGENGNTDMWDTYFSEEDISEINEWEYKYIH